MSVYLNSSNINREQSESVDTFDSQQFLNNDTLQCSRAKVSRTYSKFNPNQLSSSCEGLAWMVSLSRVIHCAFGWAIFCWMETYLEKLGRSLILRKLFFLNWTERIKSMRSFWAPYTGKIKDKEKECYVNKCKLDEQFNHYLILKDDCECRVHLIKQGCYYI